MCQCQFNRHKDIRNNEYKTLFLVAALSTTDNTSLLQQLNSGFKRTINWNKYPNLDANGNLDYLVNPSFQGPCRPFVLLSENQTGRRGHGKC